MRKITNKISITIIIFLVLSTIIPSIHVKGVEKSWKTPSGISQENLESTIDKLVKPYINGESEEKVAGVAVAIVKDGKIAFEKGYGYSDIESGKTVDTKKTVFEYGSVTKLFVWTAAMQLVEEGKLDLNKDIKEYLPKEFKLNLKYDEPITMLHLMNHTAGFEDYILGLFAEEKDMEDLSKALELSRPNQVYKPGEVSSYSNYGVALAGYIIESITGEDFYKYVDNNILNKIGENDISLDPRLNFTNEFQEDKSKGYDYKLNEGEWSNTPLYPAGSANGSITSLSKFAISLLNERKNESTIFKNKGTIEELLKTSYSIDEEVPGISHGFFQYDGEYKTFWHNGSTKNFNSFFAIVPEEDFAIIALSNTELTGNKLIHEIGWEILKKQEVSIKGNSEELPSTEIVTGEYISPRRCYHGITQLINLFQPVDIKVEAINENQISINGETFKQIKPYVYQSEKTGKRCGFEVKDNKVVKYSNVVEYIPNDISNSIKIYSSYVILVLIIVIIIVITASVILDLFKFICTKKVYSNFKLQRKGMSILATVIIMISNLVWIGYNCLNYVYFKYIRLNIGFNIILQIVMFIISIRIINELKKLDNKLYKFIYKAAVLLTILIFIWMFIWGGFNIFS